MAGTPLSAFTDAGTDTWHWRTMRECFWLSCVEKPEGQSDEDREAFVRRWVAEHEPEPPPGWAEAHPHPLLTR